MFGKKYWKNLKFYFLKIDYQIWVSEWKETNHIQFLIYRPLTKQ